MNLNKKIVKTMVFALGLGAFSVLGASTVKAAPPAANKVKLTPRTESLTIEADEANAKFWGIAKEARNEKNANLTVGDKKYTVSEVNPIVNKTIDLTTFSKSKKIMIAVGSQETVADAEWIIKEVEPASKDFTVEYLSIAKEVGKKVKGIDADAKKLGKDGVGFLVATKTKDGSALTWASEVDNIEVQEGDGAWADFNTQFGGKDSAAVEKKLQSYITNGKTLKFRLKATDSWNSNVSTVKFDAVPKAPSVKFDVTKGTTTLKKSMEYKVVPKGKTVAAFTEVADKVDFKTLNVYSGTDSISELGGTILVRTKATEKKLASKEAIYTVNKKDKITLTPDGNQEKALIAGKLKAELKVKYDIRKGAILSNEDTIDYEYYLSYSGDEIENPKWKKLGKKKTKGGKSIPTKVNLKYSETDRADAFGGENTKIFVRVAGEKQTGNVFTLASPTANAAFKFTNIAQEITADPTTTTINSKKATAINQSVTFTIANLQKKGSSPKIKVTQKVSGVSVKVSKFSTADKSVVSIKASKSAFKTAGNHELRFTISAESGSLEYVVKFTITD